jgi:hypothetical protein
MNESAVYNESDLAAFPRRLGELRPERLGVWKTSEALERQLNECALQAERRRIGLPSDAESRYEL